MGAEITTTRSPRGGHAVLVATGILLSRLSGLARLWFFSRYFGLRSEAADAFNAAVKIPNFLQNLFGEGALSASFIPVYARLLAEGDEEEAGRVAGAIASLLAAGITVIVAAGVLLTPLFVDLVAYGLDGEVRELTIQLVRILFPGTGLLVLSAWCLGILNSHRRFLLPYTAPVLWNVAMIVALVVFGRRVGLERLAEILAWASVAGSALQLLVQLPLALHLARGLRLSLSARSAHVRTVIGNFGPAFLSRGVVQISGYVDLWIASFLPTGAITGLSYAQVLYTLPVSLFGMSVSAAELPAMSSELGSSEAVALQLRRRLDEGLRRIAFFVVPSTAAFLALGDVVAGTIFQTGQFTRGDAIYVWGILAGSSVGLLASTLGRLYSAGFFALRDTRTPMRIAMLRVTLAGVAGYLAATRLPGIVGIDPRWGAAALTAVSGFAGWIEFTLLRATLSRRIGRTGLSARYAGQLWMAAGLAAAAGWMVRMAIPGWHPLPAGIVVLGCYGVSYLSLTVLLGIPEAAAASRRAMRLVRRG